MCWATVRPFILVFVINSVVCLCLSCVMGEDTIEEKFLLEFFKTTKPQENLVSTEIHIHCIRENDKFSLKPNTTYSFFSWLRISD
jgi:hypothetical protein